MPISVAHDYGVEMPPPFPDWDEYVVRVREWFSYRMSELRPDLSFAIHPWLGGDGRFAMILALTNTDNFEEVEALARDVIGELSDAGHKDVKVVVDGRA
jgi:hypothetical protein